MDNINIIKLSDLIFIIESGTQATVMIQTNGGKYIPYGGSDVQKMSKSFIDKLYVNRITTELGMFKTGILPVLVISATDDPEFISVQYEL